MQCASGPNANQIKLPPQNVLFVLRKKILFFISFICVRIASSIVVDLTRKAISSPIYI